MQILRKIYIAFVALLAASLPFYMDAYTMGSTQYRIDSDSINSGGTSFSSSGSYSMGSTVGEVGTGFSSSSAYRMSAGYWIPEDTYVSINAVADVSLGSISGLVGGQSTSSSSWNVKTNNNLGYQLSVVASTDPALKAPQASIPDYAPAGADPDFSFNGPSASSSFGFSPEGADIIGRYKDNGSVCNFGTGDTSGACWDGFSTTPKVVSQGATANEPSGATTTLRYRVHVGSNVIQDSSGGYEASITVTATAL
ncbi:MAG TPA: hypothetical protein VGE62_01245 [Candidatus Paceibacterota bacterium]